MHRGELRLLGTVNNGGCAPPEQLNEQVQNLGNREGKIQVIGSVEATLDFAEDFSMPAKLLCHKAY